MRFFLTIFLCLICTLSFAGDYSFDSVFMKITGVSTNVTKSEASSSKISGYLERADVWFGNSTSVVNMTLFASNEFTHATTEIMANTIKATNFSIVPRICLEDTAGVTMGTNASARIPLFDQRLYVVATNGTVGYTDQNITVRVIFEQR